MVYSPLTKDSSSIKRKSLKVEKIIEAYQRDFQIDVSSYFKNLNYVDIYFCQVSNLSFYYPFQLAGDNNFYSQLSRQYSNYYSKWKWEHQMAKDHLEQSKNILEIGCGNGYFLERIKNDNNTVVGLDFNPDSIKTGRDKGLEILNESIFEHSTKYSNHYDSVVAFQLFEHVNGVFDFIQSSLKCLKKNGLFIIGVPDNDSAIFKYHSYHTLNLPPHHMLLWNKTSLKYLCELFNLELIELKNQPVDKTFKSASYKRFLNYYLGENNLSKFIHMFTRPIVKVLPVFQTGQTVIVIFKKK